jgi:tetratricopeptide (TPR) repeat protein
MRVFLFLSVLFLGACASTGSAPPPAKRMQAIEVNNHAAALFARGDYAGAVKLYRQALDLERSVENEDGIAANLINLSIAYQRLGERKSAEAAVAEILDGGVVAFPPARIAEAALRDTILKLDSGDADGAARSLERTRAACDKNCLLDGKILNVDAQLSFLRKDYAAAAASAEKGLSANRSRGEQEEVANSLRLLGASLVELNSYEKAQGSLGQALEIDKDLALPPRILRDLMLLGRAAQGRGDSSQARNYLARAQSVASAIRDEKSAAEAARLAAALPQ